MSSNIIKYDHIWSYMIGCSFFIQMLGSSFVVLDQMLRFHQSGEVSFAATKRWGSCTPEPEVPLRSSLHSGQVGPYQVWTYRAGLHRRSPRVPPRRASCSHIQYTKFIPETRAHLTGGGVRIMGSFIQRYHRWGVSTTDPDPVTLAGCNGIREENRWTVYVNLGIELRDRI